MGKTISFTSEQKSDKNIATNLEKWTTKCLGSTTDTVSETTVEETTQDDKITWKCVATQCNGNQYTLKDGNCVFSEEVIKNAIKKMSDKNNQQQPAETSTTPAKETPDIKNDTIASEVQRIQDSAKNLKIGTRITTEHRYDKEVEKALDNWRQMCEHVGETQHPSTRIVAAVAQPLSDKSGYECQVGICGLGYEPSDDGKSCQPEKKKLTYHQIPKILVMNS